MATEPASIPLGEPDDEARMGLLMSHQRRLFQYILSLLPNLQDAEDVLQETNMVLWRKFPQFEVGTSFFAWGARVAQLEVMKHRKKAASRRALVLDQAVVDLIAAEAGGDADDADARRFALQHCVGRLRKEDQELISRRYAPGASGRRLAEELGRPQNSVYKSLGRIRQALLECAGRYLARSAATGGLE